MVTSWEPRFPVRSDFRGMFPALFLVLSSRYPALIQFEKAEGSSKLS